MLELSIDTPASQSILMVVLSLPIAAECIRVDPSGKRTSVGALWLNKQRTASLAPRVLAKCRWVPPAFCPSVGPSREFAPALNRTSRIEDAAFPLDAATKSAVRPLLSLRSRFGRCSSKRSTTAAWPLSTAVINTVLPDDGSTAFTSAPLASICRTFSLSPNFVAAINSAARFLSPPNNPKIICDLPGHWFVFSSQFGGTIRPAQPSICRYSDLIEAHQVSQLISIDFGMS